MLVDDRFDFTRVIIEKKYKNAVEVGAGKGPYSEHLLYYAPLKKLYSIDKWEDKDGDDDWYKHKESYKKCKERLLPFGERSEIIKENSKEASERFDPHSMDFVYVDAGKDSRSITDDLIYWYDKVRPGGILAGKDYCLLPWDGCSIMAAVDKMSALMHERLHVTGTTVDDPVHRHYVAHMNSPINQKHEIETPTWFIIKKE